MAEKKLRLSQEVLSTEISTGVTLASVSAKLKAIRAFQMLVRSQLILNVDYGIIPGTKKPGLWKPGAEKIAKLLGCADSYDIIDKIEDWDKPFFTYKIKCQLRSIQNKDLISEGIGECNSMESKYRYRWVAENQLLPHVLKEELVTKTIKTNQGGKFTLYRTDNDEIFSQVNTILKMAKKRALVDAALSAGRLSDIFTQDLDEKVDIDLPETFETPRNNPQKPTVARNSISDTQIHTLEELAFKRYKNQNCLIELANRIGSSFGVEQIIQLTTDQAKTLIRELSSENAST